MIAGIVSRGSDSFGPMPSLTESFIVVPADSDTLILLPQLLTIGRQQPLVDPLIDRRGINAFKLGDVLGGHSVPAFSKKRL